MCSDQVRQAQQHTWVNNSRRRAGIGDDVSLHTARHTFATTLLREGVDVVLVQQLLGHANITTTMVYTHVNATDAARKAAAVLNRR
jgi:integrase/recombinase XerD